MPEAKFTMSVVLAFLFIAGGCASHWPQADTNMKAAQATFDLPPKQVLEQAKQVVTSPPLSLNIEEQTGGSFLTSGQPFPGEWHIGRRWQEQTRYRISVAPDFDAPTQRSVLQVQESTQQRTSEDAAWESSPEIHRPDRAAKLLKQISDQLRKQPPPASS